MSPAVPDLSAMSLSTPVAPAPLENGTNPQPNGTHVPSPSPLRNFTYPTTSNSGPDNATSPALPNPALLSRLPKHALLPSGTPDYVRLILTSRVYDILRETPLTPAVNLSARLGCEVFFKREDLQPVFSFKVRGAYNFMAMLPESERWRGVITCSAGNHAQGVALAGSHLSIPCTIVMPLATPSIKWRNVERLGAKVILHGADFDEAKAECARLASALKLIYVPPYDDPYVIAGQGTVGVELGRQIDLGTVDAVFAAVGGGGLVSGLAEYIKRIAPPGVKVIGAETHDGDAMARSLEKGERVLLDEVGGFSDGTAVRLVGEEPFRICKELLDGVVKVSNDELCAAIKDVFEDTRSVPEPAGALAVAGLKAYVRQNGLLNSGKKLVAVVSGANMNFGRLRFVAERAELGERRECMLSVRIPEKPGSFVKLHTLIHPRAVTEFAYRYSPPPAAESGEPHTATIFCSFSLSSQSVVLPDAERRAEIDGILDAIRREGMDAADVSENELAKSHARYLIGGRSGVADERLFRFEFPERPNALRKFLLGLQADWNISLWHYRNQGGDLGKVLVGLQVPPNEYDAFDKFLKDLGYTYVEETYNPVYKEFLCA